MYIHRLTQEEHDKLEEFVLLCCRRDERVKTYWTEPENEASLYAFQCVMASFIPRLYSYAPGTIYEITSEVPTITTGEKA